MSKIWQTPELVEFGSMQARTLEDAKLLGDHDNSDQDLTPLTQCPPGQFPCNGSGGVS